MPIPASTLTEAVRRALAEDLGRGDLTTEACVEDTTLGRAEMRAREPLVFCGAAIVAEVFRQSDREVEVQPQCADGTALQPGGCALRVAGRAASILMGERVALNFAQRVSAVATRTRDYVQALPQGSTTRIADTRKTTPGLRALERYAVRCGGGHNHREDLAAAVLIKDNHIAACGGVGQAIKAARARAPHTSRITCEVDTLEQLDQALEAGADIVMLDNFDDSELRSAVDRIGGRAIVEVSGRVTPQRVANIARAGANIISVGGLTHGVPAVDLGLDWQ